MDNSNISQPNTPLTGPTSTLVHQPPFTTMQINSGNGSSSSGWGQAQISGTESLFSSVGPNQAGSGSITSDNGASKVTQQNNQMMQAAAINNLLQGLQTRPSGQQPPAMAMFPNNNINNINNNLLQQILQLRQLQPQSAPNNPLAQAWLTALAAQPSSNKPSDLSTDDVSAQYSSSRGPSGSISSDKRRSVVVPCRARGMSMEHNFQTAYFQVTDDTKHGDGLICSFPECRNRGVKFLYCAFCKDPVAKRNFRNQHTHPDGRGKMTTQEKKPGQTSSGPAGVQKPPVTTVISKTKKRKVHEVSEGTGSTGVSSGLKTGGAASSTTNSTDEKEAKRMRADVLGKNDQDEEDAPRKLANLDKERRAAWERLLVSRPGTNDGDEMSSWLMRVMAVSDLKKSTKDALLVPQPGSSQQESSETSSISRGTTESSNEDSNESSFPQKKDSGGDKASNEGDSDW